MSHDKDTNDSLLKIESLNKVPDSENLYCWALALHSKQ